VKRHAAREFANADGTLIFGDRRDTAALLPRSTRAILHAIHKSLDLRPVLEPLRLPLLKAVCEERSTTSWLFVDDLLRINIILDMERVISRLEG